MNKKQAKQIVGSACLLLLANNQVGVINTPIQEYKPVVTISKKQDEDDLVNKVFDFFNMYQVQFSKGSTSSVISMPLISNFS